jgi:hypothetical protein
MLIGIIVEHLEVHMHKQNSLIESMIKYMQLITRPLFMRTMLPSSCRNFYIASCNINLD